MPRLAASRSADPVNRIEGGVLSPALDLHFVEPETPEPERLERGLLRRKARSEMTPGARPLVSCFQLPLGEDALSQGGSPLESALDPFDFDQVDAGAARHSASCRT